MSDTLLKWDIYEISSKTDSLNGVMLRGRIRKFGIDNNINVLAENTEDVSNGVRFAVYDMPSAQAVSTYIESILPKVQIRQVLSSVENPVLSKLKVNDSSRYTL